MGSELILGWVKARTAITEKQNMQVRVECSDGKVEGAPVGDAKEAGGIHVMSHQAVEEFSGDSLQDSKGRDHGLLHTPGWLQPKVALPLSLT